jgi:twitching motility protein PilU
VDLLAKLLKEMVDHNASDLFLTPGIVPALRINGTLKLCGKTPLPAGATESMVRLIARHQDYEAFKCSQEMNIGFDVPQLGRFRCNLFRQRRDTSLVIRSIPASVPSYEWLGLPEQLRNIVLLKHGLVLVVGPSGSGKSTTLAALMQHRAATTSSHIITIEDPIEYVLEPRLSVINQRELGVDTKSYHNALINALRQSPDVLMVGEIRDRDIMEDVIEFSDTGHLCLSTLHANTANQVFERITNMFPSDQRDSLCQSLANNVQAIVSQRLVPTIDGRRTVAYELLIATARVRDLIRRREFSALLDVIEKDTNHGMQTFDQSLYDLYRRRIISAETALEHAESASNMRLKMRLEFGQRETSTA